MDKTDKQHLLYPPNAPQRYKAAKNIELLTIPEEGHKRDGDIYGNEKQAKKYLADLADKIQQIRDLTDGEIERNKSIFDLNKGILFSGYFLDSLNRRLIDIYSLLYACCGHKYTNPYLYLDKKGAALKDNPVRIYHGENTALIQLPYLPSNRYDPHNPVFKMLNAKLYEDKEFPAWHKWTATFIHVYPSATKQISRDVDNYDYKKCIDVIAVKMKTNDMPHAFSIGGMLTINTDKYPAGTYVQISPKSSENDDFSFFENLTNSVSLPPVQIFDEGKM